MSLPAGHNTQLVAVEKPSGGRSKLDPLKGRQVAGRQRTTFMEIPERLQQIGLKNAYEPQLPAVENLHDT